MFGGQGGLQRLQEGVDKKLEDNRVQKNKVLEHKKSYQRLEEKLTTLPDKISHQVMIPFTKKAFMPGKLIHTNEIQVLLGDNYFLECSSKHAQQICSRRIKQCDEMLSELEKEMKLVEGWRSQASQLRLDQDECQDITEHFTEQQLSDWRQRHRESMQKEKKKEREKKKEDMTDEELWQRLEELEVREALEKEWEKDEEDSDDDDDDDDDDISDDEDDDLEEESGVEDDDLDDIDDEENVGESIKDVKDGGDSDDEKRVIHIVDDYKPNILKRRVSFATKKDSNEIRFAYSDNDSERLTESEIPQHPGDINNLRHHVNKPKSILKVPEDFDPSDHIVPEPEPPAARPPSEPFMNPVRDLVKENTDSAETDLPEITGPFRKVLERDLSSRKQDQDTCITVCDTESQPGPSSQVSEPSVAAPAESQPQVKRVSKFKAMRQAQKK